MERHSVFTGRMMHNARCDLPLPPRLLRSDWIGAGGDVTQSFFGDVVSKETQNETQQA